MKWYYAKDGSQHGPVSTEELQTKVTEGVVAASDLVWRDGMKDWLPITAVGDFANYLPKAGGSLVPTASGASPPASPAGGASPAASPVTTSPYRAPAAPASPGGMPGAPIPNYLWQSIVVTILCCWPFGIPAIVYAAKVDGLVARGQIAAAQEASKNAKMWAWISFGSWFVAIGLYVILIVFVGVIEG